MCVCVYTAEFPLRPLALSFCLLWRVRHSKAGERGGEGGERDSIVRHHHCREEGGESEIVTPCAELERREGGGGKEGASAVSSMEKKRRREREAFSFCSLSLSHTHTHSLYLLLSGGKNMERAPPCLLLLFPRRH